MKTKTIIQRFGSIEQAAEPGDAKIGRRYQAVMMTGEIVTDFHTGRTRYAHQLVKEGVGDLARMNSGRAPVIDNHNLWGRAGDSVLGTVEQGSVRMTPEGLVGTIQFMPDDKLPEAIRNGLESGVLQNLSISATVLGMERVESDGLVLARITEWEPYETSVVPVGADSGAHMMKIAQSIHGFGPYMQQLDGDGGDGAGGGAPAAPAPDAPAPNAAAIRKEERERVAGIHSVCQAIGAEAQPFIDAGQTVDEVRQALRGQAPPRITFHDDGPPVNAQAVRKEERERISAIREICQSPIAGDADPQPFIDANKTADQVRAELWNRGADSDDGNHRQASPTAGESSQEKTITGIQHAFLERGDPDGIVAKHEGLTIDAGEYRGISISDAGRVLMGREGRDLGYGPNVAQSILRHSAAFRQAIGIPGFLDGTDPTGIRGAQASVSQAFGGISGDLLGAQGRSDLSVVVENLMHRMLSAAYAMQAEVSSWRLCCKVAMAQDFRPQNHVFLGALPDFGTRGDTGDFPRAQTPNPEKATTQVTERGQTIVVSRTTIIDDDLGVVFQTPRLQGMGAQRLIEHMFFQLLALNSGLGPKVAVSGASNNLFNAAHDNIATAGALTAASVNVDRTTLGRQKMVGSAEAKDQSVGGFDLFGDFKLDTYLVPLELESPLMIIRDSEKEPGTDNQNTQRGTFRNIAATPYLTGTRRYGFSTGAMGGINQSPICVSFYGAQVPYLFMSEISVGRGMVWHGAIDVGVDAVNYRGAVTNAGA